MGAANSASSPAGTSHVVAPVGRKPVNNSAGLLSRMALHCPILEESEVQTTDGRQVMGTCGETSMLDVSKCKGRVVRSLPALLDIGDVLKSVIACRQAN